jgi:hypothetical protein
MMKKILVNGTFLVAMALGLVGCASEKTESQSSALKSVANVSQNEKSETPKAVANVSQKNETPSSGAAPKAVADVSQNQESETPMCQLVLKPGLTKAEIYDIAKNIQKNLKSKKNVDFYMRRFDDDAGSGFYLYNVTRRQCKTLSDSYTKSNYVTFVTSMSNKIFEDTRHQCNIPIIGKCSRDALPIIQNRIQAKNLIICTPKCDKPTAGFSYKGRSCQSLGLPAECQGFNETLTEIRK